jgi:mono/diheme cytochrome c family protein
MLRALATVALTAICAVGLWTTASGDGTESVTFSNQVVRIFQANCQSCHRPGDIAPFSLMSYEEAAPWAELIRDKTASREMPPWKAAEGCGEFRDVRRLADADIETIARWVEAGAPEGNPADMPPPLTFSDDWQMGTPDAVLVSTRGGYRLREGATEDIYRCFTIDPSFDADRFITGVDIRPGNRSVVHHVLLFVDRTGVSVGLDQADPGPGYTSFGGPGFVPTGGLGGWAPGAAPTVLPEGVGYFVPRGARVVMQIHYKPTGVAEVDTTEVGLYFARSPVRKDALFLPVINQSFTIPAGATDYPVTASVILPSWINLTMHSIAPHMHLLGREMDVKATYPDGTERCLISIRDWHFHWQGQYRYVEPVPLPGGTRIDLVARYDNSTNNHHQPSFPPVDVSWGEKTTDEMCIAFLGITVDAANREVSSPAVTSVGVRGGRLVVEGSDLRRGALVEVDGAPLRDSRAPNRHRATSKSDWQAAVPVGATVSITVLNPDGVRSAGVTFSR